MADTYATITYEDYTALYKNGELVLWNDSYLVDEHIFYNVLGGEVISSDLAYEQAQYDKWEPPQNLQDYIKEEE